jgi:hypothetical protein
VDVGRSGFSLSSVDDVVGSASVNEDVVVDDGVEMESVTGSVLGSGMESVLGMGTGSVLGMEIGSVLGIEVGSLEPLGRAEGIGVTDTEFESADFKIQHYNTRAHTHTEFHNACGILMAFSQITVKVQTHLSSVTGNYRYNRGS